MTFEQIAAVLGLIGIGGIIQALITYFISSRKKKTEAKQELKEKRYKAILLLCYAYINYTKEELRIAVNRPDIKSKESLLDELQAEWVNMSLYASDNVILKMKELLESQNTNAFNDLIIEMRRDLYSVKTKLAPNTFILND